MGFLGFGKKRDEDVVDLSEMYKRKQAREGSSGSSSISNSSAISNRSVSSNNSSSSSDSSSAGFGFLSNLASSGNGSSNSESSSSNYGYGDEDLSPEEKKKRLAKRLVDITDRLEELSNQIYHLQQRIEVLERKTASKSYD